MSSVQVVKLENGNWENEKWKKIIPFIYFEGNVEGIDLTKTRNIPLLAFYIAEILDCMRRSDLNNTAIQ